MVPDAIYTAAKAARTPLVRIDVLRERSEPSRVDFLPVRESLKQQAVWLPKLPERHSVEPDMVR